MVECLQIQSLINLYITIVLFPIKLLLNLTLYQEITELLKAFYKLSKLIGSQISQNLSILFKAIQLVHPILGEVFDGFCLTQCCLN